jgi:transcriptional regulator with XRE-family HTH domain
VSLNLFAARNAITSEVSVPTRIISYKVKIVRQDYRNMEHDFGQLLKNWRNGRRLSQLDLALTANVSARHISFLETGRATPSRSMVMQLSESLQVPRDVRNSLLKAAGFADFYRHRQQSDADMVHIREAIEWTLLRHEPFPAFALDKHWVIVNANATAQTLLATVDLKLNDSLLGAAINSEKFRSAIENWSEVARYMIARLRTESAQLGGDPVLNAAITSLTQAAGSEDANTASDLPAVISTRYRFKGTILSFFSAIAQFGTAEDIALADMKIELMFPADAETRKLLLASAPEN